MARAGWDRRFVVPLRPGTRLAFDNTKAVAKLQGMVAMSDTLANAFRRNVRVRMVALGLSQSQLADRLRVTPAFVSQMLSGHRNPGLNSLEDFAKALEIDAPELLRENLPKKFARSA
jgi:ribosome-binding protein aMBF1 (putative translation factor)